VKFDGWRVQIHRRPDDVVKLFSRNGRDITDRFPTLTDAGLYLPECVIDGELVACDTDGRPDFDDIMRREGNLCIWAFDLLALGGTDIRDKPLVERKARLRDILIDTDDDRLRYSEEFPDPVKFLQVAEKMGLEGVVSKRKNAPYRSWPRAGWIKVKTKVWREARTGVSCSNPNGGLNPALLQMNDDRDLFSRINAPQPWYARWTWKRIGIAALLFGLLILTFCTR
jgi:bifunctional non-homologous end joining protein LigD